MLFDFIIPAHMPSSTCVNFSCVDSGRIKHLKRIGILMTCLTHLPKCNAMFKVHMVRFFFI